MTKVADPKLLTFVEAINNSYLQMDVDREMLERSLEISSKELQQRYEHARTQLSELKTVYANLEESLSRVQATLEATADAILVIDLNGKVVDYNQNFAQIWRIPQEILDSGDYEQVLASGLKQLADPKPFLEKLKELYSNPDATSYDVIHFKDGTVLERFSQPQCLNGAPIGRVWSFSDVTKQRLNESRLKQVKEQLEAAQSLAHIGHWEWDVNSNLISCSREVLRILGLLEGNAPETLQELLAYFIEEDRDKLLQKLSRSRQTRSPIEIELQTKGENGSIRHIHLLGAFKQQPSDSKFLATVHDISWRKENEAQLRLARKVIESANEAIIITDTRSKILEVNDAYCQITGLSREEAIGKDPNISQSGRHDKNFFKQMWQQLEKSGEWRGEIWDRRKNGEIYPKWLSINALKNDYGKVINYVGIFSDISSLKHAEEKLQNLAYYDPLTKLPNRTLFKEHLEQSLKFSIREKFQSAVMFLDLDRFKYVNDSLGHMAGDELLKVISARLLGCIRSSDTLSRLGGDEFTILLARINSIEIVGNIAEKIIQTISNPITIDGHELYISVSIGICIIPDDGIQLADILKRADMAMYQAKENGRGQYQYYNHLMQNKAHDHVNLHAELKRALNNNELVLCYQPLVATKSEKLVGIEALVRWRHPTIGLIMPGEFIPLAEETGLIIPMGKWILREACQQNKLWQKQGLFKVPVAVNLSASQFNDEALLHHVTSSLMEADLDPEWIELEITESAAMKNAGQTIATLKQLSERGIYTSIDDFGTGYSSLSYLKRFPVKKLKIDRSFIRDINNYTDDIAIVNAIIRLAETMNLKIVAEGIECHEQAKILKELGCDYLQGFLYSKPLTSKDMENYLKKISF